MTGTEIALLVFTVLMVITGGECYRRTRSALLTLIVVLLWIVAAWYAGLII